MNCDACGAEVLDIDVKCEACGAPLTSTGAHRLVGSVVLGQYEIVDILGQGGMSVVYKGQHRLTHQEVALKILPPELAAHSQVKSRFVEEARALAALDHPNIVHLYNFGQENGCFVLAMQFVRGQTFERMILEAGRLDWPVATSVVIDVLRALEYAHGRGVVHRDMKPSNVLVREDDGSATVMDFGIAKMTTSTKLTATGQTMGTVRYMSPEQVRGQQVDHRSDIYSLGASLYEAVVGDTPFDGQTHFEIMTKHLSELPRAPAERGVQLPAALEQVIMRSMAKQPDGRYQSAREMRKALEAVLAEADLGTVETLRMSRALVAPQVRSADPAAPAATSGSADTAVHPEPPRRPSAPAPATVQPGADPGAPRGRRLWLVLAGAVALATGALAVVVMRDGARDGAGARTTAAPASAPAETPAARRPPPQLRPSGVTYAVDERFGDDGIHVLATRELDAAAVRDAHLDGRRRFLAVLRARRLADEVAPEPITIMVVPRKVLCGAEVWDSPNDCDGHETYYRPIERTFLVDEDSRKLEVHVAYAAAMAICLHRDAIHGCDDAARAFGRQLEDDHGN